jgi:hypothetical protein
MQDSSEILEQAPVNGPNKGSDMFCCKAQKRKVLLYKTKK